MMEMLMDRRIRGNTLEERARRCRRFSAWCIATSQLLFLLACNFQGSDMLAQDSPRSGPEMVKGLDLLDVQKTKHLSAALLQSKYGDNPALHHGNLVLILRNHGVKYYPLPPPRPPHLSITDSNGQQIRYDLIAGVDGESGIAFHQTQVYHLRLYFDRDGDKVFNLSFRNARPRSSGNTVPSLDGQARSGTTGPLYTVDICFRHVLIGIGRRLATGP